MVEEVIHDEPVTKNTAVRGLTGRSSPRSIGDVSFDAEDRINLPIGEFARVLGGMYHARVEYPQAVATGVPATV